METYYARTEPAREKYNARGREVTVWRKYKPSDFPTSTSKLFAEGPRLNDGTLLFPVARFNSWNRPKFGAKTTRLNGWSVHLEWLAPLTTTNTSTK